MSVQTENGHVLIATELLEFMCNFRVPGMEMQVLLTTMRKTWGWKKREDFIALSQFSKATGMNKTNVSRSLSKLITHKIIIKSDNKLKINKNYLEWIPFSVIKSDNVKSLSKVITSVIKSDNASLSKLSTTKETTTKETVTKERESTRELTESDFKEIASTYNVPLSFVLSEWDTLKNWCDAKGKKYKNYKAALRNWVKKDAIERIDHANIANSKRGIDASNL